ncbi:MAG: BREX-1 system adenine-specific DNA-methyltransferase PglX [Proteobacteria bacterium]|nr:BREX-1 system adenine-specific DNA-methyltransferase PglX [Pseudomonadota bacterium]
MTETTTTSENEPVTAAAGLTDAHKKAVRDWVPKLRELLEDEFAAQLDRLGLQPDGKHTPLGDMRLSDEAKTTRNRVQALLARDARIEGSPQRRYDNVKRELAYTLLNRLVGLKAMEARKLLYLPPPRPPGKPSDESAEAEQTEVLTPVPGQAYSRYLRDLRKAGGSRYKYQDDAEETLWRDGLTAAFRHLTHEIHIVFDPDDEYACLWPTFGTLHKVIELINNAVPPGAYRARDFLGWVYQFFNRAEKKRIREETQGSPRSSHELAVINQFYTPSWVVKALVDNTLGRLWIQMHPDSALAPKEPPPLAEDRDPSAPPVADYLVPRTAEKLRYQHWGDDDQLHRFKRARDITLLDPACGTMHFGQYAFGLFHRMYVDEIEHAGQDGWPAEPSIADERDIPAAIVENNLFGIDIDPRAVQIAALSLMLTAKEAALEHGHSPHEVIIRRANLVVANAVKLEQAQVRSLVKRVLDSQRREQPRDTAEEEARRHLAERVFQALWDNLDNVSELGSLVVVHEQLNNALDDWVQERARAKRLTGIIRRQRRSSNADQFVLQRKILEREARNIQDELLATIEEASAARHTEPADRLFAQDTAHGLALVRVLSRGFDVVVMNPPYGAFLPGVKKLVKAAYPLTYNDIYAAFIDRATRLVEREGYVGALVSRTFFNLTTFSKLRTEILLKRNPLVALLDLGFGILDDATVEAAAIVLRGGAL